MINDKQHENDKNNKKITLDSYECQCILLNEFTIIVLVRS